jgi:sugar O-acyltransferase (sialic acid O-acetyltransferase NeuD family)
MILIFGKGGQSRVVIDALKLTHPTKTLLVCDDDDISEVKILDKILLFHVAIGDNEIRAQKYKQLKNKLNPQAQGLTVCHPRANISAHAILGPGVYIGPGASINVNASIGEGTIVNTNASVDHDTTIGTFCHIAPGVNICGTLLGVGSSVGPHCSIGPRSIIGGNSFVKDDLLGSAFYYGIPAREHR